MDIAERSFIEILKQSETARFAAPGINIEIEIGDITLVEKDSILTIHIRAKDGYWVHQFRYKEVAFWTYSVDTKHLIVHIKNIDIQKEIDKQ